MGVRGGGGVGGLSVVPFDRGRFPHTHAHTHSEQVLAMQTLMDQHDPKNEKDQYINDLKELFEV